MPPRLFGSFDDDRHRTFSITRLEAYFFTHPKTFSFSQGLILWKVQPLFFTIYFTISNGIYTFNAPSKTQIKFFVDIKEYIFNLTSNYLPIFSFLFKWMSLYWSMVLKKEQFHIESCSLKDSWRIESIYSHIHMMKPIMGLARFQEDYWFRRSSFVRLLLKFVPTISEPLGHIRLAIESECLAACKWLVIIRYRILRLYLQHIRRVEYCNYSILILTNIFLIIFSIKSHSK